MIARGLRPTPVLFAAEQPVLPGDRSDPGRGADCRMRGAELYLAHGEPGLTQGFLQAPPMIPPTRTSSMVFAGQASTHRPRPIQQLSSGRYIPPCCCLMQCFRQNLAQVPQRWQRTSSITGR